MYGKIIEGNLVYSSENMELVINGVLSAVSNPLEYDLLANGYKKVRIEQVEVKEKDFEEWENEIVVYELSPQTYIPSVYDLFNAQSAKTRLFLLYENDIEKLNTFSAYLIEALNNHTKMAFVLLKRYMDSNLKQNLITQADYDNLNNILLLQNIDIYNLV